MIANDIFAFTVLAKQQFLVYFIQFSGLQSLIIIWIHSIIFIAPEKVKDIDYDII